MIWIWVALIVLLSIVAAAFHFSGAWLIVVVLVGAALVYQAKYGNWRR